MGMNLQASEASVDIARGFRQFQKADSALAKDHSDACVKHLGKGLDMFSRALEHIAKAADDAYGKAGEAIDKGNAELRKCIDAYSAGKADSAAGHYDKALESYDKALELIG